MKLKKKLVDRASAITLVITVVLFALAAEEHGLTHDLLLEAGVFLISVKLVLSTRKIEILLEEQDEQLKEIKHKIYNP